MLCSAIGTKGESEIARQWDHQANRMIPLSPSLLGGCKCDTCGIYTVGCDKLLLNHRLPPLEVLPPESLPGLMFSLVFILPPLRLTPSLRCGRMRWTHMSKPFNAPLPPSDQLTRPSVPFSIGSSQPRGLLRKGQFVGVMVWLGGKWGGGFHSDTRAMKRLDQWSVQWVPVCVNASTWVQLQS